jgi:hypothetical protein
MLDKYHSFKVQEEEEDHFRLPTVAQEYKPRKKKVQTGTGKSLP